jgi:hypothetical protein
LNYEFLEGATGDHISAVICHRQGMWLGADRVDIDHLRLDTRSYCSSYHPEQPKQISDEKNSFIVIITGAGGGMSVYRDHGPKRGWYGHDVP